MQSVSVLNSLGGLKYKPMAKRKYPENNIRRLRNKSGLTLEQLATRVEPETNHDVIAKLENGQRNLTHRWMERIARALHCEISDLLITTPGKERIETPTEREEGLLAGIQGIILALVSKKILQESDLSALFNYHLRDFRAHGQSNAAEVMNQLVNFLHSSPSGLSSPSARELPSLPRDLHHLMKSGED